MSVCVGIIGTYMYMYRVKMKTSSVYGKECRHTMFMDGLHHACVCVCGGPKTIVHICIRACVCVMVMCVLYGPAVKL